MNGTESAASGGASDRHNRIADENLGLLEVEDLDEVLGEPELYAGGDIEYDCHGEGADQVHPGLGQPADHIAELVFILVLVRLLVLS